MRRRSATLLTLSVTALVVLNGCSSSTSPSVESRSASQELAAAFDDAADTAAFRSTTLFGQTTKVEVLGLDSSTEPDPERPLAVTEVDADGDQHSVVDLSVNLAALAEPAGIDGVGFETWVVGNMITIDTTGFEELAQGGAADLGVFRPGVWTADIGTLGADRDQVVAAVVGTGLADPARLGGAFLESLEGIEVDPDDPTLFHATTDYASLSAVLGQDIELVARSAAGGIAQSTGIDLDALAEVYLEVYRDAPVELDVVIVDGALQTLSSTTDLSAIWSALFAAGDDLGFGATPADEAGLAAGILVIEQQTSFEFDDSIEVEAPTTADEDRTDELAAFLAPILGG